MTNFDSKQNANDFVAGLGNGKKSLVAVYERFLNVQAGGDATGILRLIERAEKRGDDGAAKMVKYLAEQAFNGIQIKRTKDGWTVQYKGSSVVSWAFEEIEKMALAGVSIRETAKLRAPFKVTKDYDIAALKRAVLKARSEGYADAQIQAIVLETLVASNEKAAA